MQGLVGHGTEFDFASKLGKPMGPSKQKSSGLFTLKRCELLFVSGMEGSVCSSSDR